MEYSFIPALPTACILVFSCLPAICLIIYTLYVFYIHRKYSHIPGPALDNFYLGNILELRKYYRAKTFTHYLYLRWAKEFGPLYKIHLLHRCILVPTGEAIIKELMTKSRYMKAPFAYERFHDTCGARFLGRGLVTETDHGKWLIRRCVVNPAFHTRTLAHATEIFNEMGDKWVRKLATYADGKTVFCMADLLCRITLDVIGKVAFGKELGATEDEHSLFPKSIMKILEAMSISIKDPLMKWKAEYKELVRETHEAVDFIRGQGREWIYERRDAMLRGEDVPTDILTYMLKTLEADPSLSIDDILDDFDTLFMAGHETTSNTLAFLLCEVGQKQHLIDRLQEEVDQVLGDGDYVAFDDVARLTFMGQVWKETLRLYPPAPGSARYIPKEIDVGGHRLPANSNAIVCFFVVHRLPHHYDSPSEFRPERFETDVTRPLYAYMPFSLGQRSCIGRQFAQIESKVLLSKLFKNFDFHLVKNQSFAVEETSSLRPRGGAVMTIKKRTFD